MQAEFLHYAFGDYLCVTSWNVKACARSRVERGRERNGEGQEKKLQGEHTVSLDGHVSIGLWNYNSNLLIIQRMLLSSVQGRSPAGCLRKEREEWGCDLMKESKASITLGLSKEWILGKLGHTDHNKHFLLSVYLCVMYSHHFSRFEKQACSRQKCGPLREETKYEIKAAFILVLLVWNRICLQHPWKRNGFQ